MARKAFIMVEGHNGFGLLFVQAALRLGLHPITLSADPTSYDYLAAGGIEAIRVDTDDLGALIHKCSELRTTYDIAGIIGFSGSDESACLTAAKLCRYFDLPGPDPVSIERCCDKFTQRQLLAGAGVPIPAFRSATNAMEVESSAAEIGLPVILKPAVGSGSCGVRLCSNVDEVAEHTTYLLGGKHIWRSPPRILVEEFAQGAFHCAHVTANEVIGIGAAELGPLPHFSFRQFTFPAPLSDDEYKRIAEVSLSCLQALDLGWGPTNVDLLWTKRGPVVIEVNPRLAGAPDPQLIQLAYGIDLITEHIKLVIGENWDLRRRRSHTAAVRYLNPDHDGILDWIDGDSQASAISGVVEAKLYVKPKTLIVRKGNYQDMIGHVIASSPNLARTEATLQRAIGSITWSITPLPASGEHK